MIRKYPRTRHVVGSRFQAGDEDLEAVPFAALVGRHVVVEEKMDGANCAMSFDEGAGLRLQSRGHYLTGGPRERHFDLFKRWARVIEDQLFDAIGGRYVMYGEWMHAKHTVFYDALPHYFMEFDVLDLETGEFLDTRRRGALLRGVPVASVRVLFEGVLKDEKQLWGMVGRSHFVTAGAGEARCAAAGRAGADVGLAVAESDASGVMEGLYIKVEEGGAVRERLKVVRRDFVSRIAEVGSHWMERPLIANGLRDGVDLFATEVL